VRSISGKRFCKILEEHGWELRRTRGSHFIYARPDEPTILSIPVHGDRNLKRGLLASFLKLAGRREDDL